jgi:signal peptidase I
MAQQIATPKLDAQPGEANRKPEQTRNGIAEWAVTILLLLFGTTTLVQAFVIPTGSMEDTLLIGDHLLVDKLAYAPAGPISKYLLPYEEPKHGDIIVFRYPGQISQTFVKRVIGVPGDHLKLLNQTIYRNGAPIYEPYVYHKFNFFNGTEQFPSDAYVRHDDQPGAPAEAIERNRLQRDMLEHHVVNGEVVVPPNYFFAMGDNRDNSLDSRYWGFVPRDYIIGKPVLIYWSYRASTEDLAGSSVGSLKDHFVDLAQHFFTRTRWNRTLRLIRGVPDSQLASHPLAVNPGNPNP